jgi:hypothetical protein
MRTLLLFAVLALAAQQTEPDVFPAGHFCVRADMVKSNKDHPCACRDHDDCSKPAEGQGEGPHENNQCKQFCHAEHCSCKPLCQ